MTPVRLLEYWSPPEAAGAPLACLATTFTFDADFFAQECVSRFLSLSTVAGEGDRISSIAAVLEEEDRLNEAQITVLVDRSTSAAKRNLRWDLVPVLAPGGLLHAKVAVLIWENHCRLILGSANLTGAGYRRQIEIALAIDLVDGCAVPRQVLDDLGTELRHLVDLAPGPATGGPKGRALTTLTLFASRVAGLKVRNWSAGSMRLAVAPARPGVSPLSRFPDVWRGPQPLAGTILSPFWDDKVPAPSIEAVRRLLTGRPARRRWLTLVVAIDPYTGCVAAPASVAEYPDSRVVAFKAPDEERRTLHAKLVLLESDDWVACLLGSSNATVAGHGLNRGYGHHELNMWIGCPAHSSEAKALRALAGVGNPIPVEDDRWDPIPDEDELTGASLPLGFVSCLVDPGTPPRALLSLNANEVPPIWRVTDPAGHRLVDAEQWRASGSPADVPVELPDGPLPAYLMVYWVDGADQCQAPWTANVTDRAALPLPADLRELSVDDLFAALASTRPLPVALEKELRRREHADKVEEEPDLNPLHRFDNSVLLLQRTRRVSLALARLQQRLSRPASSIDVLHWRLHGTFGPISLADGLLLSASKKQSIPGEAHFLLAELALTIAAVDWPAVTAKLDRSSADGLLSRAVVGLKQRCDKLPPAPDKALGKYLIDALKHLDDALKAARR